MTRPVAPDFDQPHRRQKNLAVTIAVILAVTAGLWLIFGGLQ